RGPEAQLVASGVVVGVVQGETADGLDTGFGQQPHRLFGDGFRLTEQRQGCTGCSVVADHFDGVRPHLNGHDVTLVCASLAPLEQLEDYRRQMGWNFPWVSSAGSDFNYDFGVAFTEEQRRQGAEYNFEFVAEPEPQREG